MKPSIGKPAPNFTASAIGGDYHEETTIQLSDFIGKNVVLYFYPKDSTPGWAAQACAIRDQWSEIQSQAVLFGISHDSIKSHESFIKKKSLPFALISDPNRDICAAYGVNGEKSILGKTLFSITERSTFIIDKQGNISHILEKVSPAKHLGALLDALSQ